MKIVRYVTIWPGIKADEVYFAHVKQASNIVVPDGSRRFKVSFDLPDLEPPFEGPVSNLEIEEES